MRSTRSCTPWDTYTSGLPAGEAGRGQAGGRRGRQLSACDMRTSGLPGGGCQERKCGASGTWWAAGRWRACGRGAPTPALLPGQASPGLPGRRAGMLQHQQRCMLGAFRSAQAAVRPCSALPKGHAPSKLGGRMKPGCEGSRRAGTCDNKRQATRLRSMPAGQGTWPAAGQQHMWRPVWFDSGPAAGWRVPAPPTSDVGEEGPIGGTQGERVRGAVGEAADAQALRVHVVLQAWMGRGKGSHGQQRECNDGRRKRLKKGGLRGLRSRLMGQMRCCRCGTASMHSTAGGGSKEQAQAMWRINPGSLLLHLSAKLLPAACCLHLSKRVLERTVHVFDI